MDWQGKLQSQLYGWSAAADSGVHHLDMSSPWQPIACVQDPLNSGQFLLRTDVEMVMDSGVDANIARVAGFTTDSDDGVVGGGTLRVTEASDGSLMTRLGSTGDAADAAGNQAAQLRSIAESVFGVAASGIYVKETLANVVNGADGTHDYYISMDDYRYASIQLETDQGSGNLEYYLGATDDDLAPAACTYQDITSLFGVASGVDNSMWFVDTPLVATHFRVRLIASTGANDGAWRVRYKKLW